MKVFKIVLVIAMSFSGYIGVQNFELLKDYNISETFEEMVEDGEVNKSIDKAHRAAKSKIVPEKEEEPDNDLLIKIGEMLLPLIAPILTRLKKKDKKGEVKTADDLMGQLAENMGVSRAFVRGRLGLGDRRKKQAKTNVKRRASD